MSFIENKITKHRNLFILLFSICLVLGIYETVFMMKISPDISTPLASALNIKEGKGYTMLIEDGICGEDNYKFFTKFPIGYSLILIPYTFITKNLTYIHTFYITIFLFILSCLSYLASFKIFKKRSLALLFMTLALYFSIKGHVVDVAALTLLIFSIYIYSSSKNYFHLAIASLLIVISFIFRFAYYPQILLIPISSIFLHYINYKKINLKDAFFTSLFLLAFSAVYFIWYYNNLDTLNRLESVERDRWVFSNILYFRPVFIDYFYDTYKMYEFLGKESMGFDGRGLEISLFQRLFLLFISVLLILVSHYYLFIKVVKSKSLFEQRFVGTVLISSVLNFGLIYFLSVYYESPKEDYTWTWAMLLRYFQINFFAFTLAIFYVLIDDVKYFSKILFFVILLLFSVEIVNKLRLMVLVYTFNPKTNLELYYPNYHILDLEKIQLKYIDERGDYCVYTNLNEFNTQEKVSLTLYCSILNFKLINEPTENRNCNLESFGNHSICFERK